MSFVDIVFSWKLHQKHLPKPPQGGNKSFSLEGIEGVSFVDIVFSWKLHQKHLPKPPQGGNKSFS
ncbi:hypothetical protein AD998_09215 [bacterium 336/3]|nr:hypothetical protein AD998_09215 [bacterium 336/3]